MSTMEAYDLGNFGSTGCFPEGSLTPWHPVERATDPLELIRANYPGLSLSAEVIAELNNVETRTGVQVAGSMAVAETRTPA